MKAKYLRSKKSGTKSQVVCLFDAAAVWAINEGSIACGRARGVTDAKYPRFQSIYSPLLPSLGWERL